MESSDKDPARMSADSDVAMPGGHADQINTHSPANGQIVPVTDEQNDMNIKNELKFRENLYRLIISQLFYDGYQHIAVGLSGSVQVK
jgi:hypothetical protein